jgi:hypothetical protein
MEGKAGGRKSGGVALAFYDTATAERLLTMPIRFVGKGGEGHGH